MTLKKRFSNHNIRVKKGDLAQSFGELAKLLGLGIGQDKDLLFIDFDRTKGGSSIVKFNARGQCSYPFGSNRYSTKEIYDCIEFAIHAIKLYQIKKAQNDDSL